MSQCSRWADWNGPEVVESPILGFVWRFASFGKTLDAGMKHATKRCIAVVCKKEERKELAAEEES